ncbi:MAG: pyridoxamine 5'-phosphate oxidase family protein [Planctomycetota bacterium]|nr:pyridoxamine 5'-phosphate oxidase family protein [Planctomycetota bacterium]
MPGPFHKGEIAVQERYGGRTMAEAVGRTIRDHMPASAREFVQQLPFVVLGGADDRGEVWATHLVGEPGFVRPVGERTFIIDGGILPGDPLEETLRRVGSPIGMIGIEPRTRRRVRLNGQIEAVETDVITVLTAEVFANCPKYIQAREFPTSSSRVPGEVRRNENLDDCQRGWIESADTFFIATVNGDRGADCSHRGGMPGFVRVHDDKRLSFPDYVGNSMFQALGNIESDPRAGLVFTDYASGTLVHVTGDARVDESGERRAEFDGAERVVELKVKGVIERAAVLPLADTFVDYSRFNPGAPRDLSARQSDTGAWIRSIGGCSPEPDA